MRVWVELVAVVLYVGLVVGGWRWRWVGRCVGVGAGRLPEVQAG